MKIDADKLMLELRKRAFSVDGVLSVNLSTVEECLAGQQCKAKCESGDKCENLARYSSGYCAIHDLLLNEGRGERVS